MSDQNAAPSAHPAPPARLSLDFVSLDSWAVAAASAFIVLIVLGVLPRVFW